MTDTKDLLRGLREEAARIASLGPDATAAMRVMFEAFVAIQKLEAQLRAAQTIIAGMDRREWERALREIDPTGQGRD